jgi:rod shape-determining protein MreC
MAVITPDGIVGKVIDAYPTASQALLASDPGFAAGVVSQKNHVRGILRGIGSGKCKVDNVQNEEKVDVGEMFFTSGDDRIFPRGMPVGKAAVVQDGSPSPFKDILIYPSGLQNGPEEVLIVLNGVHQDIPDEPSDNEEKIYLGSAAPPSKKEFVSTIPGPTTEADHIVERYKKIGDLEGHKFGEGNVPNFNVPIPSTAAAGTVPSAKPLAPKVSSPSAVPAAGRAATPDPEKPIPLDSQRPRPVKPITPLPSTAPSTTPPATPPQQQD